MTELLASVLEFRIGFSPSASLLTCLFLLPRAHAVSPRPILSQSKSPWSAHLDSKAWSVTVSGQISTLIETFLDLKTNGGCNRTGSSP